MVIEQVSGFCRNLWETRGYVALQSESGFEFLNKEFSADGRPVKAAMHFTSTPVKPSGSWLRISSVPIPRWCPNLSGYFVNVP